MNRQAILDQVYGVLVELRANHPHGLRCLGSGNCHEVLTRFGVDGQVAVLSGLALELLEEHEDGLENPTQLIELLAPQLTKAGKLREPFEHDCNGIEPGEKDEHGIRTHPNLLFTAVNHNGKRYGVEADASASPSGGLEYFQDWRDMAELKELGFRIISMWDGVEGRFLDDHEIASQLPHLSHN